MGYRIDQLASTCGVSVDTVRYYQSRRLLLPPRREGRIAWYDEGHVRRIARIRDLHSRGLTLAAVRRVVDRELDRADQDLALALATAQAPGDEPQLAFEELAARCGLLDSALPLTELLTIAEAQTAAMRRTAEQAVALFDTHVRRPIRARGGSDAEVAEMMVIAFESLLPAATAIVAHHFRQVLLAVAEEHLAEVGDAAEIAAYRSAAIPRLQLVWSE